MPSRNATPLGSFSPLAIGEDLIGPVVAVLIDHGVDRVAGGLVAAADEDGALAAEGHLAGVGDAGGKQLDLEPGRHLDLVERQVRRGRGLRPHACRGRRGQYPGNPDSGDRQGQGEGDEGRFAHPEMVIRLFSLGKPARCYFFAGVLFFQHLSAGTSV